ncbi:MAG: ribosome biogenesis GTPase Der [Pirellulales bacterium]|jgi:GTP-binding protein
MSADTYTEDEDESTTLPPPVRTPRRHVPQVVIVGRPNVGKSTLFNWLIEKRIAIEDPTEGVTRDRLVQRVRLGMSRDDTDGPVVDLIDTGGMGFDDPDGLTEQIDTQILAGLAEAAVVVFVVDVRAGLLAGDQFVAERIRKLGGKVLLIANKADNEKLDVHIHEFDVLGFGPALPTSPRQKRHRRELIEAISAHLPEASSEERGEGSEDDELELPEMKLAIVGRRNVGKSTFVNALAQEERVITSPVAGTTRDSIDVRFDVDGHTFMAIDTPGLRRTKSRKSDLDYYAAHRAERSIRRADVVLLFFDASEPIGKVDKKLIDAIVESSKPVVFVVNKWDLYAGDVARTEWLEYLRDEFRTMPWAPVAFITAKTGRQVKRVIDTAQRLFRQSRSRVPTARLNEIIRQAVEDHNPPSDRRGRPVRIYYATQVETAPPTVMLSVSAAMAVSQPYRRYLINVLREATPFREVPIKLLVRGRQDNDPKP